MRGNRAPRGGRSPPATARRLRPERIDLEDGKGTLREAGFPPAGIEAHPPSGAGYALLAAAVALLALAGYVGYEVYPRFGLPRVEAIGLVLLAAAAGIASFFSPCAFPLLLTLLARETGSAREHRVRPLLFSLALSAGATGFLLLIGGAIALGGRGLLGEVTFDSTAGRIIRGIVGSALILLGLVQRESSRIRFTRWEGRPDAWRGSRRGSGGGARHSGSCSSGSAICWRGSAEPGRSWPVWSGMP